MFFVSYCSFPILLGWLNFFLNFFFWIAFILQVTMNHKYLTCVRLNSKKMEGIIGLAYNVVSFDSLGGIFNKCLMTSLHAGILESTREACVLFNVRWRG